MEKMPVRVGEGKTEISSNMRFILHWPAVT